jgi:TonB family protein
MQAARLRLGLKIDMTFGCRGLYMEFNLTNGIEKKDNNEQIGQTDLSVSLRESLGADKSAGRLNSYQALQLANGSSEENSAPKFFSLSLGLHALALLAMTMMTVPSIEQSKTETITIELEKTKPLLRVQAKGDDVMPSPMGSASKMGAQNDSEDIAEARPAKIAAAPKSLAQVSPRSLAPAAPKIIAKSIPKAASFADDQSAAIAALEQAISLPAERAVERPVERANTQKVQSTAPRATAKTTIKAAPMTIDDIEAPQLDQGELSTKTVKTDLSDDLKNDLDDDFSRIDQTHDKALTAEKAKMDDLASDLTSKQEDKLSALQDENKKDSARFEAHQQSLRKSNKEALARAEAKERDEATAAAAVAAAELAAEQKAAEQKAASQQAAEQKAAAQAIAAQEATAKNAALRNARNSKSKNASNGVGFSNGSGVGFNNSNGLGSDLASTGKGPNAGDPGSPSGNVRSLDQLRQMPGNPRPQYDPKERQKGDQGTIDFYAYVSKEGTLNKFSLKKSTGFRNLDSKTLAALKKWRFYPGQEGWVELPFQWDIKGGVQEIGGRLRTTLAKDSQ